LAAMILGAPSMSGTRLGTGEVDLSLPLSLSLAFAPN